MNKPVNPAIVDAYPLCRMQSGMYYHSITAVEDVLYHDVFSLCIECKFSAEAFESAISDLLAAHPVLRSSFEFSKFSEPMQLVHRVGTVRFSVLEAPTNNAEQTISLIESQIKRLQKMPFNLGESSQIRFTVIKRSTTMFQLLVDAHHMILDGWSMATLLTELFSGYLFNLGLVTSALPRTKHSASFKEFVKLEASEIASEHNRKFWREYIEDFSYRPLVLDPQSTQHGIISSSHSLSAYQHRLEELAKKEKVNLKDVLLAIHLRVCAFIEGTNRAATNLVTNGRLEKAGGDEVAGLFLNTIPCVVSLQEQQSWRELIKTVNEEQKKISRFRRFPYAEIVQQHGATVSDICFNYVHFHVYRSIQGVDGFNIVAGEIREQDNFPLSITFHKGLTQTLDLIIQHNSAVIDTYSATRIVGYYEQAIESILFNPDAFYLDQQQLLLGEKESRELLEELNSQSDEIFQDIPVHGLIEKQTSQLPDKIALVYQQESLTYERLNERVNQLAHYLLLHYQVRPETVVGIFLDRSINMVVALLGAIKAGTTYLPLDPEYPEARLSHMIEDSNCSLIITSNALTNKLPGSIAHFCLDAPNINLADFATHNPVIESTELVNSRAMYIIYTSGTTGVPKGVVVEHGAFSQHVQTCQKTYAIHTSDKLMNFASVSFDAAQEQIFAPLISGATLYIRPQALWTSEEFIDFCSNHQLTIVDLPPSYALQLLQDNDITEKLGKLPLATMILGGEPLNPELLELWQRKNFDFDIINAYGPTEAVVTSSIARYRKGQTRGSITIGRALPGRRYYILNEGKILPRGAIGELYIGGTCLARGYLNNPLLNEEKFIADPFFVAKNSQLSRMYRTGDLVRWNTDGEIEYLGRADEQVKIRGFRIELGEIESNLIQHESVRDAVVLVRNGADDIPFLVAHVALKYTGKDDPVSQQEKFVISIKHHLERALPAHMVPTAFSFPDSLPLTTSGKVDKKALATSELHLDFGFYSAPRTETEEAICKIWQEILKVERVGVHDNFFALGGHSLLVVKMLARLQKLEFNLSINQILANPTVESLAEAITNSSNMGAEIFIAPENLIPENCSLITPEMLPLVSLTQEEVDALVMQVPGGIGNIKDIYPLAPLQEGILFHHISSSNGDPYVSPLLLKLSDRQETASLLEALQFVINRHDVLRTGIYWENIGAPIQVVCRKAILPVRWIELDENQDLLEYMNAECAPAKQWMDLHQPPLLRITVASKKSSPQHIVLLQSHHIVSDHVDLETIQREIALYRQGKGNELPPSRPYREFVAHVQYLTTHHDAQAFFHTMLGDVDEPTLPFGLADTLGDGDRIEETTGRLDEGFSLRLRNIARNMSLSPAVIFHAAWALLVAQCSGRDDVVFGTVVSGRLQGTAGAETMLGVFINTLPIRVRILDQTATALVEQVQQSLAALLPYEQTSLVKAQGCSGVPNGTPLFSSILNYRHTTRVEIGGNDISIMNGDSNPTGGIEYLDSQERTNYPFSLSVDDDGEAFSFNVQVDNVLKADRILGYIQTIVARLINALDDKSALGVKYLSVLPQHEQHHLLFGLNDTAFESRDQRLVHQKFEDCVVTSPAAPAARFEDSVINYAELNARANQLAHFLRNEREVKPDSLVAICLERSIEMVVAILGILKAGGAYVPLDPDYPEARLKYMLEDTATKTVITTKSLQNQLALDDAQALCVDQPEIQIRLSTQLSENIDVDLLGLTAAHLAYVIYTSGSTGKPKGVMIEHGALSNRIQWMDSEYKSRPSDIILQKTPFSFDVSVWEFIWPLTVGASMVLAKPGGHRDAAYLTDLICAVGVTKLHFVPSMLAGMLSAGDLSRCKSVEQVFCSGEALTAHHVREFFESCSHAELHNLYGPTEAAIDVSYWDCGSTNKRPSNVPIGKPIDNIQLYILDQNLNLLPEGAVGELHIGGVGLARGYLNRPELTQEKFIANPFYRSDESASERLYKTGDLARWLPDGNIDYLGRIDHQVKIRGFRIELGEIEAAILSYPGIKEALVLAKPDTEGDMRLVAYVVATAENYASLPAGSDEAAQNIRQIRSHLQTTLPEHMVPWAIVPLAEMPLTPNGKADRKRLPEPQFIANDTGYLAPENDLQKSLCSSWSEILQIEKIGINDNFFELGGDSLKALKLISRASRLGLKLSPAQIFSHPTIAGLTSTASNIEILVPQQLPTTVGVTPLSSAQQWFFRAMPINPNWGDITQFFQRPTLDLKILRRSMEELINIHDSLRAKFVFDSGRWQQILVSPSQLAIEITYRDLTELPQVERTAAVIQDVHHYHGNMDLAVPPLVKAHVFYYGADVGYILQFRIHHLLIDGFSMDILYEDWDAIYHSLATQQNVPYFATATTVQEWINKLTQMTNTSVFQHEYDYWVNRSWHKVAKMPVDHPNNQNLSTRGTAQERNLTLPKAKAVVLEKFRHQNQVIPVADVLTSVVATTIAQYCQQSAVVLKVVDAARHIDSQVDLSRTLGWLAMSRILFLNVIPHGNCTSSQIMDICQQLHDIPLKGLGYEMLQNYHDKEEVRRHFDTLANPEILLNYHGTLQKPLEANSEPEKLNKVARGLSQFWPENPFDILLVCDAAFVDGDLNISLQYSSALFEEKTILNFLECMRYNLESLCEDLTSSLHGKRNIPELSAP